MIDIEITLDKAGLGVIRNGLCRIVIYNNLEGTPRLGNYEWLISHQAGTSSASTTLPSAELLLSDDSHVWKRGTLEGFPRRLGAAILLAKVLRAAFPKESAHR
jgi:hypothetical protein